MFILNKIRDFYIRHCVEITPKGRAVQNYCQRIIDGTLKDTDCISAYEKIINDVVENTSMSRQETAQMLYDYLTQVK